MFIIRKTGTLESIYFAAWDEERGDGNSFNSKNVFTLHAKIVMALFGAKPRN
jgi:hypothetical protein